MGEGRGIGLEDEKGKWKEFQKEKMMERKLGSEKEHEKACSQETHLENQQENVWVLSEDDWRDSYSEKSSESC